jgi:hypothetical protein
MLKPTPILIRMRSRWLSASQPRATAGLICAIKRIGAFFKGLHNPLHGFIKNHANDPLQNYILEFKIHKKYHLAALQSSTRLAKLSRKTLKLITKSAATTSLLPAVSRDRIRAAEHHGRNAG